MLFHPIVNWSMMCCQQLCSPDDIVTACSMFETLKLPLKYLLTQCLLVLQYHIFIIRLHKFDSGVLVVQSVSHSKEVIIEETAKLVSTMAILFGLWVCCC